MSWTYSGNPADSDSDSVRFLVGDTDSDDQQVTDEEIAWALTQAGGIYSAAALIASTIAAKFARMVDKAVGDLKISYGQRAGHYEKLTAALKRKASVFGAVPYAGGISISDKESVREDTDRVKPAFSVGMDDRQGTSSDHGNNDIFEDC